MKYCGIDLHPTGGVVVISDEDNRIAFQKRPAIGKVLRPPADASRSGDRLTSG